MENPTNVLRDLIDTLRPTIGYKVADGLIERLHFFEVEPSEETQED